MPKTKVQSPGSREPRAAPASSEFAANDPVHKVLAFLADLGSSDAFQELCSLKDVNESLQQQKAKSQTAYEENLQQLLHQEQTLAQERATHAAELELEQANRAAEAAHLKKAQSDLETEREELGRAQNTITDYDARIQQLINQKKAKEKAISKLEAEKDSLLVDNADLTQQNQHLKTEREELKKVEQSHLSLRSFLVELVPLEERHSQMYAICSLLFPATC